MRVRVSQECFERIFHESPPQHHAPVHICARTRTHTSNVVCVDNLKFSTVGAIFRDENKYLGEWLEFHLCQVADTHEHYHTPHNHTSSLLFFLTAPKRTQRWNHAHI